MPLPLSDKENPEQNYPSNQIRLEELTLCSWSVKCKGQRSMAGWEVIHVGIQPPALSLATCITLADSYT